MIAFCHMCTIAHSDWSTFVDIEAYYTDMGVRPVPPIMQCLRCEFRIPQARLWVGPQEQEETGISAQEYAQMELF